MQFDPVKRYPFQLQSMFAGRLVWIAMAAALHLTTIGLNSKLVAQEATVAQTAGVQLQPEQLQQKLEPLAAAHAGDVAISVRVMDESNQVTCHWQYHGQRVMPTASLIKLPIMLEAYRQAALGEIALTDMLTLTAEDQVPGSGILTEHFSPGLSLSLRDAVRLMIRYSDNTATNLVVDHIGIPSIAKSMAEWGWPETRLHSKVFRRDTSIALERSELYGLGSTTANDMTELLVRLAKGELVSVDASQAMLEHLQSCDDKLKLPRDLPKEFTVAHKTGSVNRSRTAAGIVSGPGIKFAICVLTDKNDDASWSEDNAADVLIGTIARAVVDLLQEQTAGSTGPSAVKNGADANLTELATLRLGATGAQVETLQRTLNERIAAGLGVDGDFGSATEEAVKKFQAANKLAASGVVDQPTWSALGTLIDQDEPVPDPQVINAQRLGQSAPLDPHAPPEVTATAWASVDMVSGQVFGGKELHKRLHIASTTKIMTALLVVEAAKRNPAVLEELITFSKRADTTLGSTSGVRTGERLPVRELLYGLLLPSGNDASVALAEHFGSRLLAEKAAEEPEEQQEQQKKQEQKQQPEAAQAVLADDTAAGLAYDRFVEAMNRRAAELGMSDTHFVNPHGLPDDAHLSSAADLATLARAAWQLPLMREIVQTRVHGARVHAAGDAARNLRWFNTNRLLTQHGFVGMKTGTTTAAGACLVAVGLSAEGKSETIVVVLGSSSSAARYMDARNVFAWTWRLH